MHSNSERFKYYMKRNLNRNRNYIRRKYIRGCAKLLNYHPVSHFYAGKKIINRINTNSVISEMINSKMPFAVSRFGNTELNVMAFHQMKELLNIKDDHIVWNSIEAKPDKYISSKNQFNNAIDKWCGFFPLTDDNISKFVDTLLNSISDIDLLGTWNVYMEEYYIETYMKKCILTDLYYLEPWFSKNPWSSMLAGKKVLVIHPFEETIQSQYKRRSVIFNNKEILPEFDLKTLKAVQTIAGNRDSRFSNWFEALEYMFDEAMKINFDIAILGCGAYGMPLAVKLKRAGKQAIHLGGATQLMFGIRGARWEASNYPTKIAKLFNDYWVRPGETERIKNKEIVENGCYW